MRQQAYDTGIHRGAREAADNPLITGAARQTQPQYQTSELLIGALSQKFRVAEMPATMRRRISRESEKGGNAFFGLRYVR
jgi:hypothetical protein